MFLSERTAGRILTELKQKGLCSGGDAKLALASLPVKLPAQQKAASFRARLAPSAADEMLIEDLTVSLSYGPEFSSAP